MKTTLQAYNAIRKQLGDDPALYSLQDTKFQVLPLQPASTPSEVAAAVHEFAPEEGWLCMQSRLRIWHRGQLNPVEPGDGAILCAELARTDHRSLHIRQDGDGGWLLTEIRDGNEGRRGLYHTAKLIGDNLVRGRLVYRVYWELDRDQGWRTCASRLSHIEPDDTLATDPRKED